MADRNPNEVIPNPDPSNVTSAAIDRAVSNAFDVVNAKLEGMEKAVAVFQADLTRVPTAVDRAISGLRELLEQRFNGMDKDIAGMHKTLDTRDFSVKEQITHLHDLTFSEIKKLSDVSLERFNRIDTQFIERDKRTDQLSLADKTAVAAALQAAKEAVGAQNTSNSIAIAKSESSTVESIRQLQTLFNSAIAAVNDKLNDTRSRLDRGDGSVNGQNSTRDEYREKRSENWGAITGTAFVVSAVVSVIAFLLHHNAY